MSVSIQIPASRAEVDQIIRGWVPWLRLIHGAAQVHTRYAHRRWELRSIAIERGTGRGDQPYALAGEIGRDDPDEDGQVYVLTGDGGQQVQHWGQRDGREWLEWDAEQRMLKACAQHVEVAYWSIWDLQVHELGRHIGFGTWGPRLALHTPRPL